MDGWMPGYMGVRGGGWVDVCRGQVRKLLAQVLVYHRTGRCIAEQHTTHIRFLKICKDASLFTKGSMDDEMTSDAEFVVEVPT